MSAVQRPGLPNAAALQRAVVDSLRSLTEAQRAEYERVKPGFLSGVEAALDMALAEALMARVHELLANIGKSSESIDGDFRITVPKPDTDVAAAQGHLLRDARACCQAFGFTGLSVTAGPLGEVEVAGKYTLRKLETPLACAVNSALLGFPPDDAKAAVATALAALGASFGASFGERKEAFKSDMKRAIEAGNAGYLSDTMHMDATTPLGEAKPGEVLTALLATAQQFKDQLQTQGFTEVTPTLVPAAPADPGRAATPGYYTTGYRRSSYGRRTAHQTWVQGSPAAPPRPATPARLWFQVSLDVTGAKKDLEAKLAAAREAAES